MTKAAKMALRAAKIPQLAQGTTAQFLMWSETKDAALPGFEAQLDPEWHNYHKEIIARPVESTVRDTK